jgi:hypothetical protein
MYEFSRELPDFPGKSFLFEEIPATEDSNPQGRAQP